ncbi:MULTISPECIES: Holliday junction resolvase RuvX [unclassified Campylobacter]|uniref:Holliday junction resolvase RuvX n=1 Tax=unclassified Campylobacter TaxID=2593542 RepID=UPI001237F918|nr:MULTISPECIES: Holliday junction resolvase RuvX [unclassified Campylobacter]KAA6225343.1 Holliday junction resolvase RuvX [Campylobacter sp. LR185c]KAA6227039.1 Holliday junction resolvase RuvX [Campylobacter sp. LR196d]KAA6227610.1 Holliday junction resolvase RuvX [Campylobacter sp. LR286c]KAA6229475.1 Holliday junction resolvase RuvX [Campylobacter sp. LR264d]KAA6230720.1 Holliday junction resolvase RuvX [Campylobacter sp. LR291e]
MKILSLDIGLKRIGLALGVNNIATPLTAIIRKNRKQAASEIKNIIKEYEISTLLIGFPKGGNSEKEMTLRIKHFVSLLEFNGQIIFKDESFTSKEALTLKQFKSKKKDGKLDSLAALVLLRDYLGITL